jgi:tetratricopeptide (TPR) repeat protein
MKEMDVFNSRMQYRKLYLALSVIAGIFVFPSSYGSAVSDPVTPQKLISSHADALNSYRARPTDSEYHRARRAIEILKAGGVDDALAGKITGIPSKEMARILNDHGFFLDKGDYSDEALNVYRKVIQLDPDRAVVYLNLGDNLRFKLFRANSFQEKLNLTKEAKTAYQRFKQLGGKAPREVERFLTHNIADVSQKGLCEYVATFTNEGRLLEIMGTGDSILKSNGRSKMRVQTTYAGSGHIASLEATNIDPNDPEPISDSELPVLSNHESWAGKFDFIPFNDGHHLLTRNNGGYLIRTAPIGAAQHPECHFTNRVIESFDNKRSKYPELCQYVLREKPPYINKTEGHSLSKDVCAKEGRGTTLCGEMALIVDFDNDGKEDALVSMYETIPGGRACTSDWFELLNSKRDDFSATDRRAILKALTTDSRQNCGSFETRTGWFRYNGVTYFERKYAGEQPTNSLEEIHTVSFIKNGRIEIACEATFKRQVE